MSYITFTLFYFLLVRSIYAVAVPPSPDLKGSLTQPSVKWSPQVILSFPGSPNFETATERWTIFDPPTYSASVTVANEQDVANAVSLSGVILHAVEIKTPQINIARALKVPFLATGGRHGYGTTLGRLDNGLSIDLSHLKTVSIDKKAATMTIGGGVVFADIVAPLFAAGFQIRTLTIKTIIYPFL